MARTDWAELQVEQLLSVPLVSEFVFRSPKHNDPDEKEVIDHLIVHRGQSIILSQKAQDDPLKRSDTRNAQWVLKNIQNALKPVRGVVRNPDLRPKWCEHPRRGHVEFTTLPPIAHAIVLAETSRPVDLYSESADLPLEYMGVPITYLSLNDFLNLVVQLRTVPELLEYLGHRRSLPTTALHTIGDEKPLFELYLANGGNLNGCTGHADARRAIETHADLVQEALARNAEYRYFSGLMEHVADSLATRDPNYAEGLSKDALALFDVDSKRQNYMVLQEVLTNLRLRERAELGRAFHTLCDHVSRQPQGLAFQAAHFDGRHWVFLLCSSKNCDKPTLFRIVHGLTGGALAHYQKRNCFVIVDRDGEHYDLALSRPDYLPTAEDAAVGKKHFGSRHVSTMDISRL
jgi:hypothetical protein